MWRMICKLTMLTQNRTKCCGGVFHALLTRRARLSWLMDHEVCPCVYNNYCVCVCAAWPEYDSIIVSPIPPLAKLVLVALKIVLAFACMASFRA